VETIVEPTNWLPFILLCFSIFLIKKRSSKSWFDYHLTKSFGPHYCERQYLDGRNLDQSQTISAFVLSAKANAIAKASGSSGFEISRLGNRRLGLFRERYER
jgi:hypothetical protein